MTNDKQENFHFLRLITMKINRKAIELRGFTEGPIQDKISLSLSINAGRKV